MRKLIFTRLSAVRMLGFACMVLGLSGMSVLRAEDKKESIVPAIKRVMQYVTKNDVSLTSVSSDDKKLLKRVLKQVEKAAREDAGDKAPREEAAVFGDPDYPVSPFSSADLEAIRQTLCIIRNLIGEPGAVDCDAMTCADFETIFQFLTCMCGADNSTSLLEVIESQVEAIEGLLSIMGSEIEVIDSKVDVTNSELEVIESKADVCCGQLNSKVDGLTSMVDVLLDSNCGAISLTGVAGGITITDPGYYCLANSFSSTGAAAITITANNVVLDLSSKVISGVGGTDGIVIAAGLTDVVVRNGVVRGMAANGIVVQSDMVTIEDCTLINNAIAGISCVAANEGSISDCKVSGNTSFAGPVYGISLNGCTAMHVNECEVLGLRSTTTAIGFYAIDGTTNLFENCVAERVRTESANSADTVAGIYLDGTENCSKVINCKVDGTTVVTPSDEGYVSAYGIRVNDLTGTLTNVAGADQITSALAWSPNGYYLATHSITSTDLNIYSFDGSLLTLIATAAVDAAASNATQDVAWSADGNFIAVGGADVRVFAFDGNNLVQVATVAGLNASAVSWSASGLYLAAEDGTDVNVYAFNGTSLVLSASVSIGTAINTIAWSHNGNYLAVGSTLPISGANLQVFLFTGTALTVTTATAVFGTALFGDAPFQLDWSPTDAFLMAAGQVDTGGDALRVYQFTDAGLSSTLSAPVASAYTSTASGDGFNAGSWSPDGKYIVVAQNANTGSGATRIYAFAYNGSYALTEVPPSPYDVTLGVQFASASWTADEQFVAVGSEFSVGPELIIYSADITGASRCLVQNSTVSCVNGINGSGIGISAASSSNFAYGNVAFSDDINYALVTNVYNDGLFGTPSSLENISIPPL